jgi:hypothetical protein
MLIMFRPEKSVPERSGLVSFDGITFIPGLNRGITAETWDKIKDQDVVKQYLEWNALEVMKQDEQPVVDPTTATATAIPADEDPHVNDLSGMSIENAQRLIEEVSDVATLEAYLQNEQRKTLVNAINRRITEIKEGRA